MAYFSDSPLEVVEQVIDALQDDLTALKACSQTCLSLLPLCRKYIFQSVELTPRRWSPPQLPRLPRAIVLFERLLDTNPGIADYVQNLVYQTEAPDLEDDDVPRLLERFHRVKNFRFIGVDVDWNTLRPPFRESLSNIIQSRSLTRLELSCLRNLPITTFTHCVNLIDLTLLQLQDAVVESYEQEHSMSETIPQLQSFTSDCGRYTKQLLMARRSDNLPVLDFSNVRRLGFNGNSPPDFVLALALIRATEKLQNLDYTVNYWADGFRGLAASMITSSLSTLRRLYLEFGIEDDIQDPLCGLCEELGAFAGRNVIEEIILAAYVSTDCRCKTSDEWGRLDAVLAAGFPKLSQVSLRILIAAFSSDGAPLQEKLNKLPEEQFPRLSKSKYNSEVRFFDGRIFSLKFMYIK